MSTTKQQGMKWFHFLIYFVLWLNAAVCALTGGMVLSGMIYEGLGASAAEIYATFPLMQTIDMAYGIGMIAFALFCILTRSRLAKFKKGAPVLLYAFYIVSIILNIGYTLGSALAMNLGVQDMLLTVLTPDTIGTIGGTIIAICINSVYFGKRAHLFVN